VVEATSMFIGKILKVVLYVILAVFAAVLVIGLIAYLTAPKQYNVLVIGSDQRGTERARSDVLFVVSIPKDDDTQPVFLSIPRDSKVEHSKHGLQKITHFYALGERPDDGKLLGNVDLTREAVEDLLDLKMDATVEFTFESFGEIVNGAGGVTLDGKQVDAEAALAQIRDRFTEGRSDFDRQEDEREVFRAMLTKMKSPSKVRELYDYFQESENARLHINKTRAAHFLYGAGIARKGNVSIGEMKQLSVPGKGERIYTPSFGKALYYWVVDEEALRKLIEENFGS
jgi:anionic cell wall polymer biosynthesis LytR-Cps2A-Psr (LCP) family protein